MTTATQRIPTLSAIKKLADAIPPEPLTEAEKVRLNRERVERGWRLDGFIDEIGKLVSELRQLSGRSGARLVPAMHVDGFVAFGIAPLDGAGIPHLAEIPDAYIGTISDGEFSISTPLPRSLYTEADCACELRCWNLKAGARIDWRT